LAFLILIFGTAIGVVLKSSESSFRNDKRHPKPSLPTRELHSTQDNWGTGKTGQAMLAARFMLRYPRPSACEKSGDD
jgi:hypothetical protein